MCQVSSLGNGSYDFFNACMPENEKTKDCFIRIYFLKVSGCQYAAGESGLIPVTGV